MTFEKLFEEYMKSPQFRKLSVNSKQMYIYSGGKIAGHLKDKPIKDIRRPDLFRFQNEYAEKTALANAALRLASVVFAYALDMDLIEHNPAARLRKLKIGSHIKWTVDEVKAMIALNDRKISTAVALAWYTGQREADVLGMRWKDYDGMYIAVTQGKTNLEMKIRVHGDLAFYLNRIRGLEPDENYIVSGTTLMSGPAFRNMLKRRTDAAGINKVFHGIRKGVASSLAEGGSPISEIAAIMGHKTMRMAAYYAEQASNKTLTENAVNSLASCID